MTAPSSRIRSALLARQLCLGTWMQSYDSTIAEVLAVSGFDWLAVDAEHTDAGVAEFARVARAIHGHPVSPLVRVRENDTLAIRQMLDMGAEGVIVPLINSAEEAQRAVRAAKYPPVGERGFAFCRANRWGRDFDDYARLANDAVAVVVMIESQAGVEHIDEILAVDGVDGVFIGPYDMSGSYGVVGQTDARVVKDACQKVAKACEQAGKSAGLHVVLPSESAVRQAIDDGFTFIGLGVDTIFVQQRAEQAAAMARAAGESR